MKEEITLLAQELWANENGRFICPACRGGASEEASLSITKRPGTILYYCYRASCGVKGAIGDHSCKIGETKKKSIAKPYTYDLIALKEADKDRFRIDYKLTTGEIEQNGFKYNPVRNTFVFPIMDRYGHEIGLVDRSYRGRIPKAINYWFQDNMDYLLHFPCNIRADSDILFLVEDTISAIRLARHCYVAAILGSNVSHKNMAWIADNFNHIVMCLDPDATIKAIEQKKKYGSLFKSFKVKVLTADPKDMSEVQLREEVF